MGKQLDHRLALADDVAPAAALLLARLEVAVLLLEPLLGDAQALDQARVGDGEARGGGQQGERVDVLGGQHPGGVAVVDLEDADQRIAREKRHADGAADGRADQRIAPADLTRGVGGEHGRTLLRDLAEDAAGDGHRARGREPTALAHAGEHRHERLRELLLALVAQDQRDVRSQRGEVQGGVGDLAEDLVEPHGGPNFALQRVDFRDLVGV
jgi:hypothetical protein